MARTDHKFETSLFVLFIFSAALVTCQRSAYHPNSSLPVESSHKSKTVTVSPDSTSPEYDGIENISALLEFYQSHANQLVWIKDESLNRDADSLLKMIRQIRYFGLIPQNYHISELNILAQTSLVKSPERVDILLSDAFVQLFHDITNGRGLQSNKLSSVEAKPLLDTAFRNGVVPTLTKNESKYIAYKDLKHALKKLIDSSDSMQQSLLDGLVNDSLMVCKQVQTIEINLNRWRMERQITTQPYIIINIPGYALEMISQDSIIFGSRVIVGKPLKPTPELSSKIDCLTLFPYWFVPRKIATEEYLPLIKKDRSFLVKNRFDVIDKTGQLKNIDSVKWEKFNKNNFPVVLRQREGYDNSLGIVKFTFDNPYSVYLHDTNTRQLFRSEMRAFSHGCIRVEKAIALAHILFTGKLDHESPQLLRYLSEIKRRSLEVKPMPIHVRYFTCKIIDGTLVFYDDIYHKDAEIYDALYNAPVEVLLE